MLIISSCNDRQQVQAPHRVKVANIKVKNRSYCAGIYAVKHLVILMYNPGEVDG